MLKAAINLAAVQAGAAVGVDVGDVAHIEAHAVGEFAAVAAVEVDL